ncbi:cytochrome c family protein [Solidesulfovibrio sp.]
MVRWRACFQALLTVGLCACPIGFANVLPAAAAEMPSTYVGSKVCMGCHPKEYDSFSKYSKKAHSSQSIKIMAPKLSPEELTGCFACHTTGYGKPGGFVSFEKTPELADAGCEVCHGPGSDHADAGGDPNLIQSKLAMAQCESCHNADRVRTFNFKPMLFAGAH